VFVGDEAATAVMVPAIPRQESPYADHPWLLVNDNFENVPTCIDVDKFWLAADYKTKTSSIFEVIFIASLSDSRFLFWLKGFYFG